MARTAAIITALLLLAGCSSNGSSGASGSAKYDQTWTKSYGSTTCGEFKSRMSEHERFVMAADMIGSTAADRTGNKDLPPDSLVDNVVSQMSTACEADSSVAMTDIAVGLFMIDSSLYTY
ncbi:MAG: hypothetical protein JWP40_984 [Blastococcus sp.]|nr:hypothetical protein [Blastococcus sp.]